MQFLRSLGLHILKVFWSCLLYTSGFSFDFTGERNVIVYQAEAGMVLDENIYRLLRSELMEEYIPVSYTHLDVYKRQF